MSTDRQRATAAANDAEKTKLQLARVIGLPIGQSFTLVDDIPAVPDPSMTLQQALDQAYSTRADYLAAIERLKAEQDTRRAAVADHLPTVRVTADYGAIGLSAGTALNTFNVTGAVDVPIFEGGKQQARLAKADAELKRQQAQVEDMKASIYYDVRTAFLDLQATQEELQTATRSRELANQQLQQSRDRFAAGVASNIEVVQAQEAVALATDQYIGALYGFNIAKAMLAQSIGTAEDAVRKYLGGPTQ
jgi:outer membrane protein TolC